MILLLLEGKDTRVAHEDREKYIITIIKQQF